MESQNRSISSEIYESATKDGLIFNIDNIHCLASKDIQTSNQTPENLTFAGSDMEKPNFSDTEAFNALQAKNLNDIPSIPIPEDGLPTPASDTSPRTPTSSLYTLPWLQPQVGPMVIPIACCSYANTDFIQGIPVPAPISSLLSPSTLLPIPAFGSPMNSYLPPHELLCMNTAKPSYKQTETHGVAIHIIQSFAAIPYEPETVSRVALKRKAPKCKQSSDEPEHKSNPTKRLPPFTIIHTDSYVSSKDLATHTVSSPATGNLNTSHCTSKRKAKLALKKVNSY